MGDTKRGTGALSTVATQLLTGSTEFANASAQRQRQHSIGGVAALDRPAARRGAAVRFASAHLRQARRTYAAL